MHQVYSFTAEYSSDICAEHHPCTIDISLDWTHVRIGQTQGKHIPISNSDVFSTKIYSHTYVRKLFKDRERMDAGALSEYVLMRVSGVHGGNYVFRFKDVETADDFLTKFHLCTDHEDLEEFLAN